MSVSILQRNSKVALPDVEGILAIRKRLYSGSNGANVSPNSAFITEFLYNKF